MKGAVNQLLGINNNGVAVGFYNDAKGNSHPYEVNQATGVFTALHVPGKTAVATGINNSGDIVGFATGSAGKSFSWLLAGGHLTTFGFPGIAGGSHTQAFGINDSGQIVGSYLDGSGMSHGFVLTGPKGPASHWQTIDDPNSVGSTVVNVFYNAAVHAGFTPASAGNTYGMLAVVNKAFLQLQSMPSGTADSSGQIVNQTRTVAGVTSPIPATGWYLTLHEGNSQNILSAGQPTIFFRPLLCANL
jgi:uncharacterized membrane protein